MAETGRGVVRPEFRADVAQRLADAVGQVAPRGVDRAWGAAARARRLDRVRGAARTQSARWADGAHAGAADRPVRRGHVAGALRAAREPLLGQPASAER